MNDEKIKEFFLWLAGFLDATGDEMGPEQVELLRDKVKEVFASVTTAAVA